jgi:hypothetical protein
MQRTVPSTVLFVVAVLIIGDFFFKVPIVNNWAKDIRNWVTVVANVALGLGGANLIMVHLRNVNRRKKEWEHSLVLVVLFVFVVVLGIARTTNDRVYAFIFNNINVPIGSTLFATAAFQMASASYRTFRVRNIESVGLLLTGILVMLGKVSIGETIWAGFPDFAQWLLDVWNTSTQRGIMICTAIGMIVASIRVIVGLERSHFGMRE